MSWCPDRWKSNNHFRPTSSTAPCWSNTATCCPLLVLFSLSFLLLLQSLLFHLPLFEFHLVLLIFFYSIFLFFIISLFFSLFFPSFLLSFLLLPHFSNVSFFLHHCLSTSNPLLLFPFLPFHSLFLFLSYFHSRFPVHSLSSFSAFCSFSSQLHLCEDPPTRRLQPWNINSVESSYIPWQPGGLAH